MKQTKTLYYIFGSLTYILQSIDFSFYLEDTLIDECLTWMTTCLGKSCSFSLLCKPFVNYLSVYIFSYFPFGFHGRIWDLIVSVPDHCLSFYLGHWFMVTQRLTLKKDLYFWVHWLCFVCQILNEPRHEKTCFYHMQTTKSQISLHIRAVWWVPLLFAA